VNILDRIALTKQKEVDQLDAHQATVEALKDRLLKRGHRDFMAALRSPARGRVALIAEVKKASPSKGVICPDFDPEAIARSYEQAGASCLSVLTDESYFQGSLDYLKRIREVVSLPLLRKDFILDPRQIDQAIDYGADAILLIVAMLDDARLEALHQRATQAGLAALVEVHDEEELKRALGIGATLVGVNNRNLKDFSVDLSTTCRVASLWQQLGKPEGALLVAESGLDRAEDVHQVHAGGAGAILVGESLMKNPAGIDQKVAELLS
jgi:indole-3-glycerol phosphate synthase